ncbi:MAG: flagellar hook-basal body protein [Clostridiaceae bacterium]|nr:flagellar hook-basal body protein [Clostridiaceae bacterium]
MRGIYIAATGLMSHARSMDVTGNNLANLDTTGYKRDRLAQRSFGEHLTYLLTPESDAVPIGTVTHGVVVDEAETWYGQGAVEQTGRSLDLAIAGNGFFTVTLPEGTALTRNGRFTMDAEGFLADAAGNRLQGVGGPIRLQSSDFTVDETGNVYENGALAGALRITCPADPAGMQKLGENYYTYNGAEDAFEGKIVQGALEASNVDVTNEMAGMIADTRAFQTCAQVLRTMDELTAKAVQLGSIK